ncbi:MAG: triose-phosphate isomerase [Candidatus Rhabdochlamydia sp.]
MTKKTIIAANWKMHKMADDVIAFFQQFLPLVEDMKASIWLAPSPVLLQQVLNITKNSSLKIGAQNISHEIYGAFTGETSIEQIAYLGASFVIIGHSERRRLFQETEDQITKKIGLTLTYNLTPLLCIGETLEEREQGLTQQVLRRQLSSALKLFPHFQGAIAYEPVWAIGTGKTATLEIIQETHQHCRDILKTLCETGEDTPLLYGGSVTENSAKHLKGIKEVDGVLVGGASLEALSLTAIIQGLTQ